MGAFHLKTPLKFQFTVFEWSFQVICPQRSCTPPLGSFQKVFPSNIIGFIPGLESIRCMAPLALLIVSLLPSSSGVGGRGRPGPLGLCRSLRGLGTGSLTWRVPKMTKINQNQVYWLIWKTVYQGKLSDNVSLQGQLISNMAISTKMPKLFNYKL